MACISKLSSALNYDCDTGSTGLVSAIIINREDIASFSLSASNSSHIDGLTFVSSAKTYIIDTPKRVLTISETLKTNEGAPNAFTHSATLVVTKKINAVSELSSLVNPMANGNFVIMVLDSTGLYRIYGLYYGMSAISIERNTHDNGSWYTITMQTPEQAIGEDALTVESTIYKQVYADAIKS